MPAQVLESQLWIFTNLPTGNRELQGLALSSKTNILSMRAFRIEHNAVFDFPTP